MIDELLEYAELMHDEFGEYCIDLCRLAEHNGFTTQNKYLYKELRHEIRDNLKYFKTNYKIVKSMRTFKKRVTELVEK